MIFLLYLLLSIGGAFGFNIFLALGLLAIDWVIEF